MSDPYKKTLQVINEKGEIVNQELFDSFSDDQLVGFMKDMVWERALHEQTMNFSRQGRLGFYAPTYGEEASEMGSIAAFKDQDFLFPAYRDLPQLIKHGASVAQASYGQRVTPLVMIMATRVTGSHKSLSVHNMLKLPVLL